MPPRRPTFDVDPPRITGVVPLRDGREMEFSEFGDPDGHPLVWLHGTPGSCRQVAPAAKAAADEFGVRIIGLARPGAGRSTRHRYRRIVDIVDDVEQVVDRMGVDRFAVVGLSGGGPYTLAIGARLADRIAGLGVLGGAAPSVGPEAPEGGVTAFARQINPALRHVAPPLASLLTRAVRPLVHVADPVFAAVVGLMPDADQRVMAQPGVKDMFIDDLSRSLLDGNGLHAAAHDAVLFGRHWGFSLADVAVPVHWWHGDEDVIIPLAHGAHAAGLLPKATFVLRSGDSHLSGYAAAADVIETMHRYLVDPQP